MKKEKTKVYSLRLNPSDMDKVRELAEQEDRNTSSMMRRIIQQYQDNH